MSAVREESYLRTRLAVMASQLKSLHELEREFSEASDNDRLIGPNHLGQDWEDQLNQAWLDDLLIILRPLRGHHRDMLVQWARRTELFNIKAIVRGKLAGMAAEEIESHLYDVPEFLRLSHQSLLAADSVIDVLRLLEKTPYAAIAKRARQSFEERKDPLLLDASLDRWFYIGLMRRIATLESPHREEVRALIGANVDRHNLTWLLRYRFNYQLSAAETYTLLIPTGYRLDRYQLRELMEVHHFAGVIAALPEHLVQALNGLDTVTEVEQSLQAMIATQARTALRHSPSILARAFAYLILRYHQNRRLFLLLEGRRLGLREAWIQAAMGPVDTARQGVA